MLISKMNLENPSTPEEKRMVMLVEEFYRYLEEEKMSRTTDNAEKKALENVVLMYGEDGREILHAARRMKSALAAREFLEECDEERIEEYGEKYVRGYALDIASDKYKTRPGICN